MSKFDEIVRNIALENEKCNYNPEKDTNWSKLSWEMRRECREHMDFKTKNCLRQTGKEEKSNLSYILKFRYVVQNIALESEKSNYNPGKDTNWDILPMEMRLECVKHLDFQTRCRFRRVSKIEKSLVDSKKYRFKCFKLMFDHDHGRWDIAMKTGDGLRHEFWRENKHPDFVLISAILRHAEVENFFFMAEDCLGTAVPPVLEQLEKLAPFPFKRVLMDANLLFIFFLRHCPNLEKVDFTGTDEFSQFLLDMILDVPTVMNIKEFRFSQPSGPEFPKFLKELVQKWIDNEAEVGKSIQFELQTEGILNKASCAENPEFAPGR